MAKLTKRPKGLLPKEFGRQQYRFERCAKLLRNCRPFNSKVLRVAINPRC